MEIFQLSLCRSQLGLLSLTVMRSGWTWMLLVFSWLDSWCVNLLILFLEIEPCLALILKFNELTEIIDNGKDEWRLSFELTNGKWYQIAFSLNYHQIKHLVGVLESWWWADSKTVIWFQIRTQFDGEQDLKIFKFRRLDFYPFTDRSKH